MTDTCFPFSFVHRSVPNVQLSTFVDVPTTRTTDLSVIKDVGPDPRVPPVTIPGPVSDPPQVRPASPVK